MLGASGKMGATLSAMLRRGVCGRTTQARSEAALARELGYEAALLSPIHAVRFDVGSWLASEIARKRASYTDHF